MDSSRSKRIVLGAVFDNDDLEIVGGECRSKTAARRRANSSMHSASLYAEVTTEIFLRIGPQVRLTPRPDSQILTMPWSDKWRSIVEQMWSRCASVIPG